MTEELTVQSYCEVCGIDVDPNNTNLKTFGKLFCSDVHLNQYVNARQKKMGLLEEREGENADYAKARKRRRRIWFGGC